MASKESCTYCGAKIAPQSFCPKCGQPTAHISASERIAWEMNQWQSTRSGGLTPPPVVAARPQEQPVVSQPAVAQPTVANIRASAEEIRATTAEKARKRTKHIAAARTERGAMIQRLRRGGAPQDDGSATRTMAPQPAQPAATTYAPLPTQAPAAQTQNYAPATRTTMSSSSLAVAQAPAPMAPPAPALQVAPPAAEPKRARRSERKAERKAAERAEAARAALERTTVEASRAPAKRDAVVAEPAKGLDLRKGEKVLHEIEGWSRGRRAKLLVTSYRVALVRMPGRVHWIPLDQVEAMNIVGFGVHTIVIEGSVEHLTLQRRSRKALDEFRTRLNWEVEDAQRPGARRHDADLLQEWCDRSQHVWDSHSGRLRLWVNRHPAIAIGSAAAAFGLVQLFMR